MLNVFGSMLRKLVQNLEELSFYVNNYEDDCCAKSDGAGFLVEIRSLEHTSVEIESLVGDRVYLREEAPKLADVLPPSLETLHLHWDIFVREDRSRQVTNAVRNSHEHGNIPDLRKYSFERWFNKILRAEFDRPVASWDMTAETMHQ